MIGESTLEKDASFMSVSVALMVRCVFVFESIFCRTFFPFQITYRIGKAFILNKIKNKKIQVNNKKVENKVWEMVWVGVGRVLLSH